MNPINNHQIGLATHHEYEAKYRHAGTNTAVSPPTKQQSFSFSLKHFLKKIFSSSQPERVIAIKKTQTSQ